MYHPTRLCGTPLVYLISTFPGNPSHNIYRFRAVTLCNTSKYRVTLVASLFTLDLQNYKYKIDGFQRLLLTHAFLALANHSGVT